MGGQHGAEEGLPGTGPPVERQHQRPLGVTVGQKAPHLLGHDVLRQMLPVEIGVKVPFQVWFGVNEEGFATEIPFNNSMVIVRIILTMWTGWSD